MKETNRNLLEELILGEKSFEDPTVIRAISEDPEFAREAQSAAGTLNVLKRNAERIDEVDMGALPVTEEHRSAARDGLLPRTRSPILRHSLWLIPSAAAAVLVFSQMQTAPSPNPTPNNATLGGTQEGAALVQTNNGFTMYNLGDSILEGETARIQVFASDMETKSLFKSSHTKTSQITLTPEQQTKLDGYDRVWVVVEYVHPAGHMRSIPGQYWSR